MNGFIFNIKRFAIHDGPGIRTTAFFQGCPLNCPWCHNPESMGPPRCCPSGSRTGDVRATTADELVDLLERDRVFYEESEGGITISGGEPLMQPAFLMETLKEAAGRGLHTAVDTSGEAAQDTIRAILPFTDLFLYDIKLMDSDEHQRWTGVDNRRILENLSMVCTSGTPVWVRVPLIAGITDTMNNIRRVADHISGLSGIERIHLLPYHAGGEHKRDPQSLPLSRTRLKAPGKQRLNEIYSILEQTGISVFTGG